MLQNCQDIKINFDCEVKDVRDSPPQKKSAKEQLCLETNTGKVTYSNALLLDNSCSYSAHVPKSTFAPFAACASPSSARERLAAPVREQPCHQAAAAVAAAVATLRQAAVADPCPAAAAACR